MVDFPFEVIGSRFGKGQMFGSRPGAAVDDSVLILVIIDVPLEKSGVPLEARPLSGRFGDDILNNHACEAAFRADMQLAEPIIGRGAIPTSIVKQRTHFGNAACADRTCKELPDVDCMGVFAARTAASTPKSEIRV